MILLDKQPGGTTEWASEAYVVPTECHSRQRAPRARRRLALADRENCRYVAELLGHVSILDADGQVVAYIGEEQSPAPDQVLKPHCVAGDSHGDLYVGQAEDAPRVQKLTLCFPDGYHQSLSRLLDLAKATVA
jgi:hypothetical protein